jgi:hypothetical protein
LIVVTRPRDGVWLSIDDKAEIDGDDARCLVFEVIGWSEVTGAGRSRGSSLARTNVAGLPLVVVLQAPWEQLSLLRPGRFLSRPVCRLKSPGLAI